MVISAAVARSLRHRQQDRVLATEHYMLESERKRVTPVVQYVCDALSVLLVLVVAMV